MSELKELLDVEVKSASRGEISAVFSTFGVVDRDNDYTFPTAFESGAAVPISQWGHASVIRGALPAGKGVIRTTSREAILDGKFFLGTTAGRETFDTVAQLAESGLGQWSYSYDVLNPRELVTVGGRTANALRKLQVHEVSPVLTGAGIGTRTLVAKDDDPAREAALVEYARFLGMKVADLRERVADMQRAEVLAIRDERDRVDVAAIRAALL